MIENTQTALTDWLYHHNLTGLAVGLVAAAVVGTLYWLTRHGTRAGRWKAVVFTMVAMAVAAAAGVFVLATDTFLSAACGVVGVASCLVLADLLLMKRKV